MKTTNEQTELTRIDRLALSLYGKTYSELPDDGQEQDHIFHFSEQEDERLHAKTLPEVAIDCRSK